MNLKKLVYLLMTLILVLTLSACRKNQTQNMEVTETTVNTTENKEGAVTQEAIRTTEEQCEMNENTAEETQDLVVYDDVYIEIPVDPENMETIPIGEGIVELELSEYEKYLMMSGDEQAKYVESFESIDAFFDWYKAAKKEYESGNKNIEIGSNMIIDANG